MHANTARMRLEKSNAVHSVVKLHRHVPLSAAFTPTALVRNEMLDGTVAGGSGPRRLETVRSRVEEEVLSLHFKGQLYSSSHWSVAVARRYRLGGSS